MAQQEQLQAWLSKNGRSLSANSVEIIDALSKLVYAMGDELEEKRLQDVLDGTQDDWGR